MDLFGYNTDNIMSGNTAALPDQPVDAAGGAPASYAQQTMDLFKFGLSAAVADRAQTNQLDYQRFETTNGNIVRQGQTAGVKVPGAGGGNTTLLMIGGGVLLVALLVWKFK